MKDLTFRVQDLEADTAVAAIRHTVLKRVLWLQTRAVRCPDTVPAVTVNQGMVPVFAAISGPRRRYDLNECLLPLDPKASLFACENSRDGSRHSRECEIGNESAYTHGASRQINPPSRFSRITRNSGDLIKFIFIETRLPIRNTRTKCYRM